MSDHIIPGALTLAVASGKGGSGKTTSAVSLAAALAARGVDVIVIDADLTGPNVHLIAEVKDLELGVDHDELKLRLPQSSFGFRVISPVSVSKTEARADANVSDLIGIAQFADPAQVVIVDLPPGWTDEHEPVCSVLPDLVVTLVTPTKPALSDHLRHVKTWTRQWKKAVQNRRERDKRRKLDLPDEPTFIVAETMARFTGLPEGGDTPVTVRRLDAMPEEVVTKYANPVVSIPAAGDIASTAQTPEIGKLVDLVMERLNPVDLNPADQAAG